jgi:hypothetical protein
VKFEVNQQQWDQNEDAETGKYYSRSGDGLRQSNKASKVLRGEFEEDQTSNEDSKDFRPGLNHARLVSISDLLDNKRVQGDVLQDHSHHHNYAQHCKEVGFLQLRIK